MTGAETLAAIYKWVDGVWCPEGFADSAVDSINGKIRFKDTVTENFINLFIITRSDMNDDPILICDQGAVFKKDIAAGGFLSTNQGCLYIGHGLTSATDPPAIKLLHSADGYSTLYLRKMDGSAAHLNVGNLTCTSLNDAESFTASGAVTQYCIAAIVGNDMVAVANRTIAPAQIGVFQESKTDGQTVSVQKRGRSYVVAGEDLTAGDRVTTDASGHAIKYMGHYHDKGTFVLSSENPQTSGPNAGDVVSLPNGFHYHVVAEHSHGGSTGTDNPQTSGPNAAADLTVVVSVDANTGNNNPSTSGPTGDGGSATTVDGYLVEFTYTTGLHYHVVASHGHTVGSSTATSSTNSHYHIVAEHSHTIASENPQTSGPTGEGGTTNVAGESHYHVVAEHTHTLSGNSGTVATGDFLGKVLVGATLGNNAEVEIMLGA
jgi:hypothetical protein